MFHNLKRILLMLFVVYKFDFSNGYNCFDGSDSKTSCACSNGYCNCNGLSVRDGIPCKVVGTVDSVRFFFLLNQSLV